MDRVNVIVAECGAQWVGWAHRLRDLGDRTLVLSQSPEESPGEFTRRVIERLGRLRRGGAQLQGAAYVTGHCADGATLRQRSKVTRKLSALLAHEDGATRLFLDPSTPAHGPIPTWIRALAMALSELARGSGLSVQVGPYAELPAV